MKDARRFAPLLPARKALGSYIERHTHPIREHERYVSGAQLALTRLGLGDSNALALARDPIAYAAVWFGAGALAGTLLGAFTLAFFTRPKLATHNQP